MSKKINHLKSIFILAIFYFLSILSLCLDDTDTYKDILIYSFRQTCVKGPFCQLEGIWHVLYVINPSMETCSHACSSINLV